MSQRPSLNPSMVARIIQCHFFDLSRYVLSIGSPYERSAATTRHFRQYCVCRSLSKTKRFAQSDAEISSPIAFQALPSFFSLATMIVQLVPFHNVDSSSSLLHTYTSIIGIGVKLPTILKVASATTWISSLPSRTLSIASPIESAYCSFEGTSVTEVLASFLDFATR